MWDLLAPLERCLAEGTPAGLATLVAVEGSSPREVGASLVLEPRSGIFSGSVSSGCVENVLLERLPALVAEEEVEYLDFGPEEVVPWAVGLTCGGTIRVRLERYFGFSSDPVMREIANVWLAFLRTDEPGVLLSRGNRHCLMMSDGSILGKRADWPLETLQRAVELTRSGGNCEFSGSAAGEPIFLRVNRPRPRLFVIGAVHIAVELCRIAATLPLRINVVDPRRAYARRERFPLPPHQLTVAWPVNHWSDHPLDPEDAVVVLSHDSKIDDAALIAAVRAGCGYIGALGSELSQRARRSRLAESGLSADEIARIRGPVGGTIRSRQAAEIAVGILQEWNSWHRSRHP